MFDLRGSRHEVRNTKFYLTTKSTKNTQSLTKNVTIRVCKIEKKCSVFSFKYSGCLLICSSIERSDFLIFPYMTYMVNN